MSANGSKQEMGGIRANLIMNHGAPDSSHQRNSIKMKAIPSPDRQQVVVACVSVISNGSSLPGCTLFKSEPFWSSL